MATHDQEAQTGRITKPVVSDLLFEQKSFRPCRVADMHNDFVEHNREFWSFLSA